MRPYAVFLLVCLAGLACSLYGSDAPYVDSQAIKLRFSSITDADMKVLREKRILFASRSFGLNLRNGLASLAKMDAKYDLLGAYQRFDVFKAGGDLGVIPAHGFAKPSFIHFLATYWPHTKRCEEVDTLMRQDPWSFGGNVDFVVVYFHTASLALTDTYLQTMDSLQKDFPQARCIYVTSGFMGPSKDKDNESAHAFSEQVRSRCLGKVPLYDLGKILSDDFRVGHNYCPEFSNDPADVHPNSDAGQEAMAKGFLLILKEALAWSNQGSNSGAGVQVSGKVAVAEVLPVDHPESIAVRAILDANGLTEKQVEGVSVVRGGHIVELYIQEGGITRIPDDIGVLARLERLHCYADRSLPLPRLRTISPAIAKCLRLEDLLLNGNDLEVLPVEIADLRRLKTLSVADNCLHNVPLKVEMWAKRFDPKGWKLQRESTSPSAP